MNPEHGKKYAMSDRNGQFERVVTTVRHGKGTTVVLVAVDGSIPWWNGELKARKVALERFKRIAKAA